MLATYMRCMCNYNNLEIRVAGSSCHWQKGLLLSDATKTVILVTFLTNFKIWKQRHQFEDKFQAKKQGFFWKKSQTERHFIALEKCMAGSTLVRSEILRFSLIVYLNFFSYSVSDNPNVYKTIVKCIHCWILLPIVFLAGSEIKV